ncbi:hypothetical protein EPK84_11085 (plasmid) [Sinorhizobium fredii]|nr:hypothetical protein EPK84_11085 [Sinorhizobium fredii]
MAYTTSPGMGTRSRTDLARPPSRVLHPAAVRIDCDRGASQHVEIAVSFKKLAGFQSIHYAMLLAQNANILATSRAREERLPSTVVATRGDEPEFPVTARSGHSGKVPINLARARKQV